MSQCLSQITSTLNTGLPILLVWSVDWMGLNLTGLHEDKIFVDWNIDSREQFEQLVSPLFECDTNPIVRLEAERGATKAGCRWELFNPHNFLKSPQTEKHDLKIFSLATGSFSQ